jgi:hypothetical protein
VHQDLVDETALQANRRGARRLSCPPAPGGDCDGVSGDLTGQAARASFREDHPGPPVDELTYGIEVARVACGLGDHVQHDLPQVVQPPVTPLTEPPGWLRVRIGAGDDGIRELNLPRYKPTMASAGSSGPTCQTAASEARGSTCCPAKMLRNQNRSTSMARWRTSPRQVQPEGSTGRRRASSVRPSMMPRTCSR